MVKLKAEGRNGELGEGTLHSLLVKKLAEAQMQGYSRWLAEKGQERSVISLKDWLKDEVQIRVEAMEMAHGLAVTERADEWQPSNRNSKRHKSRNFQVGSEWLNRTRRPPGSGKFYRKPPCMCCDSLHHGVWACTAFLQKSYEDRLQLARDKRLCFRCLSGDHQGKTCRKSQTCQIDGCRGNHHRLLHQSLPVVDNQRRVYSQSQKVTVIPHLLQGKGQPILHHCPRERTVPSREL